MNLMEYNCSILKPLIGRSSTLVQIYVLSVQILYNCYPFHFWRHIDTYLVSRNRRRSYFTAYSRFSNPGCLADSAAVTVSASFDFKTTGGSKSYSNQFYVYLLGYNRVNRRWVRNGAAIKMDAITADTPRNVWNEFHIERDLECSEFYYVSVRWLCLSVLFLIYFVAVLIIKRSNLRGILTIESLVIEETFIESLTIFVSARFDWLREGE